MENDVTFGERVYSKVPSARPPNRRAQGSLLRIVGTGEPKVVAAGAHGPRRFRRRSARSGIRRTASTATYANPQPTGSPIHPGVAPDALSTMPNRITGLRRVCPSTTTSPAGLTSPRPYLIHVNPLADQGSLRARLPNPQSRPRFPCPSQAIHPSKPMRQCQIPQSLDMSSSARPLRQTPRRR